MGETCYSYANCYVNASWLALCHPHLKVVIGSLGTAGHFDYGGKKWKYEDFLRNIKPEAPSPPRYNPYSNPHKDPEDSG